MISYNDETSYQNDFLPQSHGTRSECPPSWGTIVGPTSQVFARFGVVGAMGAQHADFDRLEKSQDEGDPGDEPPGIEQDDAQARQQKTGGDAEEKGSQVSWREMAAHLVL